MTGPGDPRSDPSGPMVRPGRATPRRPDADLELPAALAAVSDAPPSERPEPSLPPIVPAARADEADPSPADLAGAPSDLDAEPVWQRTGAVPVTPPVLDFPLDTGLVPVTAPAQPSPDAAPTVIGDAVAAPAVAPAAGPAPVVIRRHGRPRVRRVTRVVRHVDTWSVFKVAVVFNAVFYLVCLVAGVLLWNVASSTGTVDNVERFFEQFGWSRFELEGGEIFHNAWIGGLFVAVGMTGFAVFVATLFNLITDLVGGVRVSVLEEEVVAKVHRQAGSAAAPGPLPPAADVGTASVAPVDRPESGR